MGITKAGRTSLVEALESGNPFLAEPDERTIGVQGKVMKLDDKIECKVIDCVGHKVCMLSNQLMVSDNLLALISRYQFTAQCFHCNIGDFLQVLYERNSRAQLLLWSVKRND